MLPYTVIYNAGTIYSGPVVIAVIVIVSRLTVQRLLSLLLVTHTCCNILILLTTLEQHGGTRGLINLWFRIYLLSIKERSPETTSLFFLLIYMSDSESEIVLQLLGGAEQISESDDLEPVASGSDHARRNNSNNSSGKNQYRNRRK